LLTGRAASVSHHALSHGARPMLLTKSLKRVLDDESPGR
jgi:hypothetical protein